MGTSRACFEHYRYARDRTLEFSQGRPFAVPAYRAHRPSLVDSLSMRV